MFSHMMVGSNDMARSRRFYDAVMAVLGAKGPIENVNQTGQLRLFYRLAGATFCVTQPIDGEPATVANGSTIGFACNSPEQLQAFHAAALASGGTAIEEPPGPRGSGSSVLYLAYVRDPDGHKLCALHRPAV
jgi:catechol 2,3-dioxygenase-like lactoylglutathione lyase family enzyme